MKRGGRYVAAPIFSGSSTRPPLIHIEAGGGSLGQLSASSSPSDRRGQSSVSRILSLRRHSEERPGQRVKGTDSTEARGG